MLLAAPSLAMAGPYLGIGIGGSRTESSLSELGLFPGPELPPNPPGEYGGGIPIPPDRNYRGDGDFSSTDVAFDVAAGWMFGWFGVEVGYTEFGSAEQRYELPVSCTPNPGGGCQSREWTAEMELEGYRAFIIGSLPLSESIDGYAKLGAIFWEADYAGFERNRDLIPGAPIGPRYDRVGFENDDTALAAALGVSLKSDSPFSLRIELSYYDVDTTDLVLNAQLMGVYTF